MADRNQSGKTEAKPADTHIHRDRRGHEGWETGPCKPEEQDQDCESHLVYKQRAHLPESKLEVTKVEGRGGEG